MKEQRNTMGYVSRRSFLGATAAAAGAFSVMPFTAACKNSSSGASSVSTVQGSKYAGVQVGTITYSFRDLDSGIENVLKACVESGVTSVELMSQGIETYLGAPEAPEGLGGFGGPPPGAGGSRGNAQPGGPSAGGQMTGGQAPAGVPSVEGQAPAGQGQAMAGAQGGAPGGMPPGGGFQTQTLTPEQQAAQDKYNKDLKEWRLSLPMSKYETLRKMFNDAGVNIHIVKFEPSRWSSDEEIDYAFKAAKALGAKGVSEELSEEAAKKLGPIAAKNDMYAVFHNHAQFASPGFSYDPFLEISPAVMFNFDAGHYFGSTGVHPNTIIDKYHDHIFSVHLKDKTGPNTNPANTNQVWGQGEMPMEEVLLNIRDKKYPIYCDIELEYQYPAWSNSVKEVNTCVKYCRQILLCM